MQAIIFCGIQGSGKSTFYKEHFFNTHIRISMDLLRTRNREKRLLELCLRTRARFVIDNTNPSSEERKRYLLPALAARYEVVGYFFQTSIVAALERNRLRTGRELIPDKGIRSTRNKLQLPTFDEGFHRLFYVQAEDNHRFSVWELPQEEKPV